MNFAILADSHDNVPNLKKALDWINKQGISLIIHCGDLCAPSMLTRVLIPNFKGEIHLVHGNVGDPELLEEVAKKIENVQVHGKIGELNLDGKTIAFTHFPAKAKELAKTGKYDLVFYGHTHKPWMEKLKIVSLREIPRRGKNCKLSPFGRSPVGGKIVQLVNPGTLAGMFYKACFATFDTETGELRLKILEKI